MTSKKTISDQTQDELDPASSAAQIREHLQLVMDSPAFLATASQRAFLQFVVEKVLVGESEEIKGYTVATQVFGRREDFDQNTDPIVSIQANKLRRALEAYYLDNGKYDPICIDIPKGTYVPTFHQQRNLETGPSSQKDRFVNSYVESTWPTIMVQPFQNLTGDQDLDYMAIGLATELAMEITRYQEIRVLVFNSTDKNRRVSDSGARFVIDGNVRKDATGIKIAVNLNDFKTNTRIWSDIYHSDLETAQLFHFQERIARVITATIASEFGIISKVLTIESKSQPPSELQTHQALLRYYAFNLQFSTGTFLAAFEALTKATVKEPECGLAWSMLGRLFALNHTLELSDLDTPLEKAYSFAEKGVQLEPANQRARAILAFVNLLKGNINTGLVQADLALDLNPNSLIFLAEIGYLMTLCGAWDRGPALVKKAIQLNPYYNITVHYALWVDWIRQKDYHHAHSETRHFRTPMLFWDPLMKAASLGLLERIGEGKQAAEDLLRLKPDFPINGRRLIQYYIKFDDIVENTIRGLGKVGINFS